jgi:hypothetical protein
MSYMRNLCQLSSEFFKKLYVYLSRDIKSNLKLYGQKL